MGIKKFRLPSFSVIFVILLGCGNISNKLDVYFAEYDYSASGYSLNDPSKSYPLPYELLEISGLTNIDNDNIGAVQDEKGIFYVFNTHSGEVMREIRFHDNGDYEAVELYEGTVYVIKSNGRVYKFPMTDKEKVDAESFSTRFSNRNDIEGLGQNKDLSKLNVALKGSPKVNENDAKGRAIYALNPETVKSGKNPLYSFKKKEIKPFFDSKGRSWSDNYSFRPSGIAQHPKTGNQYILCNVGKILIMADSKGKLLDVFHLNPNIFRQPEGICFDSSGKLYISNEGKGRRANILAFEYEDA